jgi:hypothetical protein
MSSIQSLKNALQKKQKKPTYKNHGLGLGAVRYEGTVIADKTSNKPLYFIIDKTEKRLPFIPCEDPQYDDEDDELWLWLPDIAGFHENGVLAKWNPNHSGNLLGKKFEIYYSHKSGCQMSYEPTDKTITVVFEEPIAEVLDEPPPLDMSEALVVAEPVAEPVAQTLEQCVMATICSVPQNVKTILKSVQSKFPTATKTNINSIIYKNTKTLKKHTIEGVSAPLWSL